MSYYAVRIGRLPGIYNTWSDCEAQVKGFPKARYKKFGLREQAASFVRGDDSGGVDAPNRTPSRSPSPAASPNSSSSGSNHSFSSDTVAVPIAELDLLIDFIQIADKQNIPVKRLTAHLTNQIEVWKHGQSKPANHGSNVGPSSNLRSSLSLSPVAVKRTYSTSSAEGKTGAQSGAQSNKKWKSNNSGDDSYTGLCFDPLRSDTSSVWTDGACFNNGRNGAMAGIGVYWANGHPKNLSARLAGRPTNNRAEIHAAREAVKQAKQMGISNLMLHTDSMFLINSITKWIKGWKRNGWVLSTGGPVINREDFEQLDRDLQGINVKWVHVRGHRGIPENEAADRLANAGANMKL